MTGARKIPPSLLASGILLALQLLCAAFFVSEFVSEVFGLRNWAVSWEIREILQVTASLGLSLGTLAGLILFRNALSRLHRAERQVQAASGAFFDMMDQSFTDWGLSPSERDVALFAIRGLSNADIATLRGTSEATVKSQINAVFRKAGVANRSQLISQFVDLLIERAPQPATVTAPSGQTAKSATP